MFLAQPVTNLRLDPHITRWLNTIDATWNGNTIPAGIQIRSYSASIRTEAQNAAVNTQGFFHDI